LSRGEDQAYRVFISSTYLDNRGRRKVVQDAILHAGMTPVGMERFTASTEPTVEECLRLSRECDLMVGIIAWRYGWVPPGHERSITELEYEAQPERLMFVIDDSVSVDPRTDYDPGPDRWDLQKQLDEFKQRISGDQMPAPFGSDSALGMLVLQALHEWRERHRERGGGRQLGPYRIEEELGAGEMAHVYLATVEDVVPGLEIGDRVAVRVPRPHLVEAPGFHERFKREIEIGRSIRHENIVRTCDARVSTEVGDDANYIVMEFVEGQTLRGLLDELTLVPEDLCRHIGREVAKALAAIHEKGIIHQNLKPRNVLVTREDVVKVMDLGVARLKGEAIRLSRQGEYGGSVLYAAPEQFTLEGKDIDGRADLYALGLTLYELAAGLHPFRHENVAAVIRKQLEETAPPLSSVNAQISPYFEEVVAQLLEKKRDARFSSAEELLQVLREGENSDWWRRRSGEIREVTKRPLRRIPMSRDTELFGRDSEIAALRDVWEKVRAGEGQMVVVEGEAGIGKTRLVDEFAARLESEGEDFNYLFGQYPPGGAATASGAFITAYREHFGAEGLEERIRTHLAATPGLVPAFSSFLREEPPPEGHEALTQESIRTMFVRTTRGLARERPTIVFIDDLHFAPEEALSLFASLALALPGHRILLVGSARPGIPEAWKAEVLGLPGTSWLELPRIGIEDMRRLLVQALRSPRLCEELLPRIAEKTDGNPFFVFEVIRGLKESELLSRDADGVWFARRPIREIPLPSSVTELVIGRIAELTNDDRDLMDVAACCGVEFDPILVGQALGIGRLATLRRLGHLERDNRLVRSTGRKYMFDHHQVQEVLYGRLSELMREEYHAVLGETREDMAGARDRDPADLDGALTLELADHFLRGGRGARAVPYFDASFENLRQSHRNDRAVALASRALAFPGLLEGVRRLDVLCEQANLLHLSGRRNEEQQVLEEAVALAEETGDAAARARAHRLLGTYWWVLSRFEEARESLGWAVMLAREAGDRSEEAAAIGVLGNVFLYSGALGDAKRSYEEHLLIAREIGDRKEEGRATGYLGVTAFREGRYPDARDHYEANLRISRETGDRTGEANATANLGILADATGRPEEAKRWAETQLELAREIGDRRAEGRASSTLGHILRQLGRLDEARQWHEQHLAIATEIGDRRGQAIALVNLGTITADLGERDAARKQIEASLSLSREVGLPHVEKGAVLSLASVLAALGRLEEARDGYEEALALSREPRDRGSEILALTNLGLLLITLGAAAPARDRLTAAKAMAEEDGIEEVKAAALTGLAVIARREGDPAAARECLDMALSVGEKLSDRKPVVEALIELGRLATFESREAAAEHFSRAVEVAESLAEPGHQVRALAWLASVSPSEAPRARSRFERHGKGLEPQIRMAVNYALYRADGNEASLLEARRILDDLVRHAPEEQRGSMLEDVPLHAEILEASGGR